MQFDWSRSKSHYPWFLGYSDYQLPSAKNFGVLEIPIATFDFFGLNLRADPVNSVLLYAAFDYYYKNVDRSGYPFVFVIMSHSIEGTHKDGTPTKVVEEIVNFFEKKGCMKDVKFHTIHDAYTMIKNQHK